MKNFKGITLIALIITIIILLILAGITISIISGNNGLINNMFSSREAHQIAEYTEIIEHAKISAEKEDLNEAYDFLSCVSNFLNEYDKFKNAKTIKIINDDNEKDEYAITQNLSIPYLYIITKENYPFYVNRDNIFVCTEYTVTYYLSKNDLDTFNTYSFKPGSKHKIEEISKLNFKKDGYTQDSEKWIDETGNKYYPGDTVNTFKKLYGEWTANTYNVKFDWNTEGTDITPPATPTDIDVTFDEAYGELPDFDGVGSYKVKFIFNNPELSINENEQEVPATRFKGWYDSKGNQITESSIVKIADDHDLFAHWSNSGELYVDPVTEPRCSNKYALIGWSTTQNATTPEYDLKNKILVTDNMTLYAVWKEAVAETIINGEDPIKFYTVQDAIDYANTKTATVKLLANCTENVTIESNQDITFNSDTYKLSSDSGYTITNKGKLTIENGEIEGSESVIKNLGTLTLGNESDDLGPTPLLNGDKYGLLNTGTFCFYNGKIRGNLSDGAISGTPATICREGEETITYSDTTHQYACLGHKEYLYGKTGVTYDNASSATIKSEEVPDFKTYTPYNSSGSYESSMPSFNFGCSKNTKGDHEVKGRLIFTNSKITIKQINDGTQHAACWLRTSTKLPVQDYVNLCCNGYGTKPFILAIDTEYKWNSGTSIYKYKTSIGTTPSTTKLDISKASGNYYVFLQIQISQGSSTTVSKTGYINSLYFETGY